MAGRAQLMAYIRGIFGRETSQTLLNGLKESDIHLDTIIQDFTALAISQRLQIGCFYETRQTNIANAAVSRWLARIFPTVTVS